MTARTTILRPGHRVTVRNAPVGKKTVADPLIVLAPGDTLTVSTVATPPPPATIPPMPPRTPNTTLYHDFATMGMGPFVAQDFPNAHEADKDPMLGWNPDKTKPRYLTQTFSTNLVTLHDGHLDLVAEKFGSGYTASLVATFAKNDATKRTFDFGYGTVRIMARIVGAGAAAWQTPLWLWDAWNAPEIDVAEVIGGKVTANVHSPDLGQVWSGPIPGGWHEWAFTRTASTIAAFLDGTLLWQRSAVIPQKMALLIDCKYGLAAPDSTTPAELRTQVAWIVVTE